MGVALSAAEELAQGLAVMRLDLPVAVQEKLLAYVALLYKWNKTFSLTALHEQEKAVSHHLLDSLAILPYLSSGNLLDVGSGGGMPGIPLAIACPDLAVSLIDSNSKKTAFLQQAAIELGLSNIFVHCGRVEQYHPSTGVSNGANKGFAMITSRAFAELADFVNLTQHLLATEGRWLALKGVWPQEEISRLPVTVQVEAVHRLSVPKIEGQRHLVVLGMGQAGCVQKNSGES